MDSSEPECDASGRSKSPLTTPACSSDIGQLCGDGTTYEHFHHPLRSPGKSMSSAAETHARETAEPEQSGMLHKRIRALNSSALLTHFARELWSEKIRIQAVPTLFGLGGACGMSLSESATLCCPSDCDPVALGHPTGETACSCSGSYPTPTASDWRGSTGKGSRRGTFAETVAVACEANGQTVYPHPESVEAVMRFPPSWTDLTR